MNTSSLSIVKIGGEILDNPGRKSSFLERFAAIGGSKILVHGGGKQASEVARTMGIEAKMIEGRRVTDARNLDVTLMVYAGLLNKKLVADLQSLGHQACGISGADGNAILASKRPPQPVDFGFAGDVEMVNASFLDVLLKNKITPVICALTHDGKGQMLNTNADTIASETAIAMCSHYNTSLYYVFDKPGVLMDVDDDSSVVPKLNAATYLRMKEREQIYAGMIPKLDNGFHALKHNVSRVLLGNHDMLKDHSQHATYLQL